MMMAAITDDDELMAIAGDLSAAPAGAAGLPMQLAQTEEGKQLQSTINERRKGMFDDVGDGDHKNDVSRMAFRRAVKENDSIFGHDFWRKMTFANKVVYEITKL